MRQQVDLGRGQRRGAFHYRQRVRLVGQPRLARPLRAAIHGAQDALGAREFAPQRRHRHPAFADTEERAQIAVTRRVEDDPLAVLGVDNALAQLELNLCCHASPSGNPQVEQASGLGTLTQQYFLRVLVSLTPQDAAEVDLMPVGHVA